MIEDRLKMKYGDYLDGLDIYENTSSLKLSRIVIKPEARSSGIGTKIMNDLTAYADANHQVIALTHQVILVVTKIDLFNFTNLLDSNTIKVST